MPINKVPNCTKDKDGLLLYVVRVDYRDADGKKRQMKRHIRGLAEAKLLEQKLLLEAKENKTSGHRMTLQELYNEYSSTKKHSTRESSQNKEKSTWRLYVASHMDTNVRLDKLTPTAMQAWRVNLDSAKLAAPTKQQGYKTLKATLNYGVKMQYISFNPMSVIEIFKNTSGIRKEITYYEPEEFKKFITVAKQCAEEQEQQGCLSEWEYFMFFNIAFYTGLRKGEIHALEWSDIDNDILRVRRSIAQKIKGADRLTSAKTPSSIRDIQLPKTLLGELIKHEKRKREMQERTGCRIICGGADMRPLRDNTISRRNKQYAEMAGVKRIRIHDFRHSHASLLANAGINIQEIARRLGHSDVRMTWNTYSHIYPKEQEKAIAVLDGI